MIVVSGHGSVKSFFFPFNYVFKWNLRDPRGIGDKSIFVLESPYGFIVNISAREAKIREFLLSGSVRIKIGINTWNSPLVGSIQTSNSIPYFSLDFKIILKVVDYSIIGLNLNFIVILVKFRCDVFWRIGILVWQPRVVFVIHHGIFLYGL